jgi:hypothetical protein
VRQFAGLKFVASPLVLQMIHRIFSARGGNYEDAIVENVRNVAPLNNLKSMRYRPLRALLALMALMARRLRLFREETLEARAAKGRRSAPVRIRR